MKNFSLLLHALLSFSLLSYSQSKIHFDHDASGNRIARYYEPGIKRQAKDTLPIGLTSDSLMVIRIDGDATTQIDSTRNIVAENKLLAKNELPNEKGVSIYPNPTLGDVYLSLTNLRDGETAQIELRDVNGRLLSSKTAGQGTVNWDLSAYAQGNYIFTVVLAGKKGVFTVVKQ